MMKSEVSAISERIKKAQIGLKDTLAVIDMALGDQIKEVSTFFPYEVFEGLNDLIDRTVHGTKIERFRPEGKNQLFHSFEIHTKRGEVVGYLNMIYLRKPIPCYYLVYVEVLPPFRGRGLGNKILLAFREFVEDTGAVGLLDNIVLPEEPTYNIYTKHGWKSIEGLIGDSKVNGDGHYMVFVPTSIEKKRKLFPKIAEPLSRIQFHNAIPQINPPLAILQEKGNAYILRRKLKGIHLEEALDQLRTSPHLKDMNRAVGIDRTLILTVNKIREWLVRVFDSNLRDEIEDFSFFVPWDIERNTPRVTVDITGVFLDTMWIA